MSYRDSYDRSFVMIAFVIPSALSVAAFCVAVITNDIPASYVSAIPVFIAVIAGYGYRTELDNE